MMISLGIWSCQWRELRPITFGGSNTQTASGQTAGPSDGGDEEQGYGRGKGTGRGGDGSGDYEMVGMNGESQIT